MTNATIETLHTRAADMVAKGAVDFITARGRRVDPAALKAALVKAHAVVPQALEDARIAWAAGMPRFAVSAFDMAMVLAGIDAAKELLATAGVQS